MIFSHFLRLYSTRNEDMKPVNIVNYDLVRPVTPPPALILHVVPRDGTLFIRWESRNTTMTVMSSWKCLLTPLSIFFRSEYLISLFFAAIRSAALTSLLAIPCRWKGAVFIRKETLNKIPYFYFVQMYF